MEFTPEATVAVNDYVDRVRLALPLSPSARMAIADHLYHEIAQACADKAAKAGRIVIDIETLREHLAELGSSDECARRLTEEHQRGAWQWPGDYFVGAFRHHRIGEKAERLARTAGEKAEFVAEKSMDAAANALEVASKKLREAADKLKGERTSDSNRA